MKNEAKYKEKREICQGRAGPSPDGEKGWNFLEKSEEICSCPQRILPDRKEIARNWSWKTAVDSSILSEAEGRWET